MWGEDTENSATDELSDLGQTTSTLWGHYSCPSEEAIRLNGLQLQRSHSDRRRETRGWRHLLLPVLIPVSVIEILLVLYTKQLACSFLLATVSDIPKTRLLWFCFGLFFSFLDLESLEPNLLLSVLVIAVYIHASFIFGSNFPPLFFFFSLSSFALASI